MKTGGLTIDLYRDGPKVARAEIASTRPLAVARLMRGKTPEDAAGLAPMVFSVCANAQGRCAASALERAANQETCLESEAGRDALALAEIAQEHLMAVALRWPVFLNEKPEPDAARRAMQACKTVKEALFDDRPPFAFGARAQPDRGAYLAAVGDIEALIEQVALGVQTSDFLSATFTDWAEESGDAPARLAGEIVRRGWADAASSEGVEHLIDADAAALSEKLSGAAVDGFVAQPEWDGAPRETTALTRRLRDPIVAQVRAEYGPGLLARVAARLVELARIPAELRVVLETPGVTAIAPKRDPASAVGISQTEAARGRLVHRARIEYGRVADYRILAPTEWNFHPRGAAARALERLSGDGETIAAQARLLIESVDPCVGYELRIH